MTAEEALERLKARRDYFIGIDFPRLAESFDLAVITIENLLNENKGLKLQLDKRDS